MRTPEQVAADDGLTEAIRAVMLAYAGDEPTAYVLTEYVVISAHHRYDDDGEPITAVSAIYRDGDVPAHRALGLMEFARARLKAFIASDYGDDDE